MSYASIVEHREMIFDDVRNGVYHQAIKQRVTPDSVVMDLGAGGGLLGILAALAGARKVYLIEPSTDLDTARQVARDAGIFDRLVFLQKPVEEITIEEQVDVILSVFTGNFLLDEDLLPSLFYARDRFLKKGGSLLPSCAVMELVPVSMPDYYLRSVSIWSEPTQGVSYTSVRQHAANNVYFDDFRECEIDYLSEPIDIHELNFSSADTASCHIARNISANARGDCHGLLGWFRMKLDDEWLTTAANCAKTHWSQVYFPLDPPLNVDAGDQLEVQLHRPQYGEWSWVVQHNGQIQKHSTFLSRPVSNEMLKKRSKNHQPDLTPRGKAALQVLQQLDGQTSSSALAQKLAASYPQLFPDEDHALRFVLHLVEQYS